MEPDILCPGSDTAVAFAKDVLEEVCHLFPSRFVHILGAQGNIWTEYVHIPAEVEHFTFPRAVALAEVVWPPAGQRDYASFRLRLKSHLGRLDQIGVN